MIFDETTAAEVAAAHDTMVSRLAKAPHLIIETLTDDGVDMLHAAVGISGEAGELLDAVKKAVIYNKPLDRENVIEELGDLEFYMAQLRQRLGVTRTQTLAANMAKLSKRYADGYSDAAAQARADKSEDVS